MQVNGWGGQSGFGTYQIAIGYVRGQSVIKADGRMKLDPRTEWTGGGLTTNPTMLVSFYGQLAENAIVSAESLSAMLASGWRDPTNPEFRYGLGLLVYSPDKFGHGGRWPGYRSQVTHFVASGVTIAVQTNQDEWYDVAALIERIVAERI